LLSIELSISQVVVMMMMMIDDVDELRIMMIENYL